jgi:hypothetical protein
MMPLKYAGIPAAIIFVFGLIFSPLRDAIFSEDQAQEVLLQAIPYVAIFITVLLLFIIFVAFVAIRLHKRVTHRTHQTIELTLVGGILIGLVSMLQSINIVGYQHGFLLLLFCLLSFILWTHVTPRATDSYKDVAGFSQRDTIAGAVVGIAIAALVIAFFSLSFKPEAPYGLRQRQWDTYDEDRQATIEDAAWSDYRSKSLPYFVILSLVPGALAFFGVREILVVGAKEDSEAIETQSVAAASQT